ncbi:FKBP-type peptidyl-prolyl cis-trans isomerase [Pedobacter hartonius]|uniref:Peptidyl-prolyl cis-trans isomerase n=1 Tax=Pedobacter hartonius TaxID=425514 RepID=A0A1H4EU37_9SPHI|nr:FKBP-type peptidyl-prolyl cis-trans isomerase [Pedobacter hartonius]SEA87732.1 FKBP-type peptidyl-prolyl cis-trans isomerase [Pedobacter hartonius]
MLKKLSGYILAFAGLTLIFTSCKKDYESIQSVDSKKITDYIAANNLTGMVEDSAKTGYYYQIVTQGTGEFLKNTDSILYDGLAKGMENGVTYLSTPSYANLGTFVGYTGSLAYQSVGYSIPAIHDVMLKMRRGATARILLPSYLAFGKNGAGDVPSNENIDLTITTYPDISQTALDDRLIQAFITSKGLSMIKDPSGVWYSVSAAGSATDPVTVNSTITVNYTGRYTDGTVFDSSTDATAVFNLSPGSGIIEGWTKTLPGKLGKGGKIRMLIPSRLGYGTSGTGTLPGNAILDFDVEVTSVTP